LRKRKKGERRKEEKEKECKSATCNNKRFIPFAGRKGREKVGELTDRSNGRKLTLTLLLSDIHLLRRKRKGGGKGKGPPSRVQRLGDLFKLALHPL